MKPHHAKRKANKQKFKNKPQPPKAAAKTADHATASPALQAAIKAAAQPAATQRTPPKKQAPAAAPKPTTRQAAPQKNAAKRTASPQKTAPKKTATAQAQKTVAAHQPERALAWRLSAAFALSALACAWLAQNSIHAYWQQTYHRDSPLAALNRSALWQVGGRLYATAASAFRSERPATAATHLAAIHPDPLSAPDTPGLPETDPSAPDAAAASTTATATATNVVLSSSDTVLFAGDSMMEGVAPHLQRRLKNSYRINSLNLSRQSTGLAYPSLFDWPATIEQTLAKDNSIKLVVVFLGPNDPWDFPNPADGRAYLAFQSPEWEAEYRRRISRIATAAEAAGARLIWVGVPHMKSAKLNQQMRYLDSLYADELKGRALWLPTDTLLDEGSGEYRDTIVIDGKNQRVRSKDGIHFTLTGQKYVAEAIARKLTLPPAADSAHDQPPADS